MKRHIVLIEDDPGILQATTMLLEFAGYQVTGFDSLISYEELADINPDCFLIDENLPGVSGHIICILLKSKPATKHIPVILTSANHQLDYAAELCEPDASIRKPFDMRELLDLISSVITTPVQKETYNYHY